MVPYRWRREAVACTESRCLFAVHQPPAEHKQQHQITEMTLVLGIFNITHQNTLSQRRNPPPSLPPKGMETRSAE
jgi:hypothetical protein